MDGGYQLTPGAPGTNGKGGMFPAGTSVATGAAALAAAGGGKIGSLRSAATVVLTTHA
jgi:hypothetical protein